MEEESRSPSQESTPAGEIMSLAHNLTPETATKYRHLTSLIRRLGSVVVAYSGGTDSSLLAVISHHLLGENSLAVTAQSETYPPRELAEAIQLAAHFKFRHLVIPTEELKTPSFSDNPPNRCYYCKQELFKKLKEIADNENARRSEGGQAYVVDGTTLTDSNDYRPGRQAAKELGVRSPFLEVGLRKEEIREISKLLGLPTWDKPSGACLASRFPYGEKITAEKLTLVGKAEELLKSLGFSTQRVRYHNEIARIEVPQAEIPKLLDPTVRNAVISSFRSLGFLYITIDLEGYRSGSMNKKLETTDYVRLDETAETKCPRCYHTPLAGVQNRQARFKQCPDCGGMWFDLNELDKAIGKRMKFVLPDGVSPNPYPAKSIKPLCPTCRAQMVRIKSLDIPDLEIEACLVCQGRWLDGAEIARLQEKGFLNHVKTLVMRLFSL